MLGMFSSRSLRFMMRSNSLVSLLKLPETLDRKIRKKSLIHSSCKVTSNADLPTLTVSPCTRLKQYLSKGTLRRVWQYSSNFAMTLSIFASSPSVST